MISYFTAASKILGGNSVKRYDEKGTGFKSIGVAFAKIKFAATPLPG